MATGDPGLMFRLRPLSVGDILDEGIRLYRAHFRVLLTITALPLLAVAVVSLLLTVTLGVNPADIFDPSSRSGRRADIAPERIVGLAAVAVIAGILSFIALSVVNGAITFAVSQLYLGRRVTVEEAYRAVADRLLALIAWPFIVGLIVGAVVLVLVLLGAGLAVGLQGGAGGSGEGAAVCLIALVVLALIGVGIWASIKLSLTNAAIVVEDRGPWSGMRRSWQLTGGHWGRVFLTELVLGILVSVLVQIPNLIGVVVADAAFGGQTMAGIVTRMLFQYIGQILFTPVTLIGVTLLYYDLRVRKEGFDVELMAQQMARANAASDFGMPPGSSPSPS